MKRQVPKVYHIIIVILMLVDAILAIYFILNKVYSTGGMLIVTLCNLIVLKSNISRNDNKK